MRRIDRRLAFVMGVVVAAGAAGTASAAFPDTDVTTYTGCLTNGATLNYVKAGLSPSQPCASPKQLVRISGGDITKLTVTGALTGGGDNGAVSIGLDPAKVVPATCTSGQVPKWSSGAWTCGADRDTTYEAGTGIDVDGDTLSVKAGFRLPQGCLSGAVAKADPATGRWVCAADGSGTGPRAYFDENEHVVEAYSDWTDVGGIGDLKAGTYVFTLAIHNRPYLTADNLESQRLRCEGFVPGGGSGIIRVPKEASGSATWAAAVTAGETLVVHCHLAEDNGGFFEGDATLARVQVSAIRVGELNP
jgi:hypothetical protein